MSEGDARRVAWRRFFLALLLNTAIDGALIWLWLAVAHWSATLLVLILAAYMIVRFCAEVYQETYKRQRRGAAYVEDHRGSIIVRILSR